jgi:hypothetical protein
LAWYQNQTLVSPAAAWYVFYLFDKNFAQSAKFLSKRMSHSTLLEANRAVLPGEHLV